MVRNKLRTLRITSKIVRRHARFAIGLDRKKGVDPETRRIAQQTPARRLS